MLKVLCAVLVLTLASPVAQAASRYRQPVPADHMTCKQAVAYYEKYKRIYVIAHGKNIVPIYGMSPVSKAATMNCGGRVSLVYYWVNTTDKERCSVAVFCR